MLINEKHPWRQNLRIDIVPILLNSRNEAVRYFAGRNLLDEQVEPIDFVWRLPATLKMISRQQSDGSWKFTGKQMPVYTEYHHRLVETFKQFRLLVERIMY